MPTKIGGSVGRKGNNLEKDVRYVQQLLNKNLPAGKAHIVVTGKVDANDPDKDPTVLLIEAVQRKEFKLDKPNGRIEPGDKTLRFLMKATLPDLLKAPLKLTEADLKTAALTLGCELACVKAVNAVETLGDGYLPSGRPKILFERHKFSKFTNGAYDNTHPDVSNPKWGGYGQGGENQYERLYEAMACDREAALKSASWGRFQVLGANYETLGYKTIDDFVTKMYQSEAQQLTAFITYVNKNGLTKALRDKRWADFARGYNGPAYKANKYDEKLQAAYKRFAEEEEKKKK